MEMIALDKELKENSYPGRGIVIGRSADGTKAVYAESESETETEAATATAAAAATEDGEAVVQTQGEKVSELYQADVVKYLIIPADSTAELPAGIEKEMILVHQPIESAYVSGDTALATLDELGLWMQ